VQSEAHKHDASCGDDHHHHEEHEEIVDNTPQQTPKEKADNYKSVQLEILSKFVKDFEDEERALRD
jgi:hypothetical protein